MLGKHSVFNAHNICGNPVRREAEVRKSSMHHDEIAFSHNRSGLIFEGWRKALDEIEQALTIGSNVRAMLDVMRRPELLGSRVVTLIEQRVERFQDKSFVLRLNCTIRCH